MPGGGLYGRPLLENARPVPSSTPGTHKGLTDTRSNGDRSIVGARAAGMRRGGPLWHRFQKMLARSRQDASTFGRQLPSALYLGDAR